MRLVHICSAVRRRVKFFAGWTTNLAVNDLFHIDSLSPMEDQSLSSSTTYRTYIILTSRLYSNKISTIDHGQVPSGSAYCLYWHLFHLDGVPRVAFAFCPPIAQSANAGITAITQFADEQVPADWGLPCLYLFGHRKIIVMLQRHSGESIERISVCTWAIPV